MRALWLLGMVVVGCGNGHRVAPPPDVVPPVVTVPAPAPAFGDGLFPMAVIADDIGSVVDLASDGAHVYWLDGESKLQRVPVNGGAIELIDEFPDEYRLGLGGDTIYVAFAEQLVAIPKAGGKERFRADVGEVVDLVVVPGYVVLYTYDGLVTVSRGSGDVSVLLAESDSAVGLAADGEYVYWADMGNQPPEPNIGMKCPMLADGTPVSCEPEPQRWGSILRIPIRGGAIETIATNQRYPTDLTLVGKWIYWSTEEGGAVVRAPKAGGAARSMFGGFASQIVADAYGVVAVANERMLVELSGAGGPPRVRSLTGAADSKIVLTEHAIILHDQWEGKIVAFPRGDAQLEVIATPRSRLMDIALSGDYVYYLDVHAKTDDRVLRVPRAGGAAEVVHRQKGSPTMLAVHGDVIVTGDPYFNKLTIGERTVSLRDAPLGLATDGVNVYWVEYDVIKSVPVAGGDVRELYRPDYGMMSSGGIPPATVLAVGGEVWATGGVLYGAVGYAEGKEARLLETSTLIATAGDGLVTFDTEVGVVVMDSGKVLMPSGEEWPSNVAASSTDAYVQMWGEDGGIVVRYPFDGSATTTWPLELAGEVMLADDDAVYFAAEGVVLRLATGS